LREPQHLRDLVDVEAPVASQQPQDPDPHRRGQSAHDVELTVRIDGAKVAPGRAASVNLLQAASSATYSADFNPIEQASAKLKALLRTTAARTVTDLHAAIQRAFSRFTPQECRNYIAAAGYEDDLTVST
jgi:hypothetical protein